MVVWLTGLPCSGKTTIAQTLQGEDISRLDGDIVRGGLCADLGFSKHDRDENLRRVAHVAAILADAGRTVVCSFVSPYKAQRDMVRKIVGPDRFKLVYVECSADECAKRDVKGMWAAAKAGKIKDFTGLDGPYEAPLDADLVVHTATESVDDSVDSVYGLMFGRLQAAGENI